MILLDAVVEVLAPADADRFTQTLDEHGVAEPVEYAICTNEVYKPLLGGTAAQIKAKRGLHKKANLRDHMPLHELAYTMASEALASERIEHQKSDGFLECRNATSEAAKSISSAKEADLATSTAAGSAPPPPLHHSPFASVMLDSLPHPSHSKWREGTPMARQSKGAVMTFSYIHVIGGLVLAIGIITAILLTAPNLMVGTNRLRLGVKFLCRTIVGTGFILCAVMLVWGVTTRSETLMYTYMIPLTVALLTSKFMQRSGM